MPDRPSLFRHWRLLIVAILLSLAFAFVFLASVERAKLSRSAELSLDTNLAPSTPTKGLTLTTRLGDLPSAKPLPRKPVQPAPWWPALLFGLAFFCGWLFRNALRTDKLIASAPELLPGPNASEARVALDSTKEGVAPLPDLAVDFPWDDAALANQLDAVELTSEERIRLLETQNASKAEIIKALERLVTENREKWLHQDETEARLDKHIRDLSQDLAVAVRQLQQLQTDTTAVRKTAAESIG